MKTLKTVFFTLIAFFSIASFVAINGCIDDSCTRLKCKNGGSCADGTCRCQSGWEGAECEFKTAAKFIGQYYGTIKCGDNFTYKDTIDIYMEAEPNMLRVTRYNKGAHESYVGRAVENRIDFQPQTFDWGVVSLKVVVNASKIEWMSSYDFYPTGQTDYCNFIGFRDL